MSTPVTVVIPTLLDRELLATCLEPLLAETEARGAIDQVLVVDDSGGGELADRLRTEFPTVEVRSRARNGGFATALTDGAGAARHELVFALNPDVRVRRGVLEPLIETLAGSGGGVHAVAPYVLMGDGEPSEESLPELCLEDGFPVIRHAPLTVTPGERHPSFPDGIPVAFALGGAFLFRRRDLLADPFDPLFAPFYWEDVDWCQSAIRRGLRVLVDPRALVEHHHRGTIAPRVPDVLVRAAIEKNRLLFAWKHFDDPTRRRAHLEALSARVLEHGVCEEREELIWFLLALEQLNEV